MTITFLVLPRLGLDAWDVAASSSEVSSVPSAFRFLELEALMTTSGVLPVRVGLAGKRSFLELGAALAFTPSFFFSAARA